VVISKEKKKEKKIVINSIFFFGRNISKVNYQRFFFFLLSKVEIQDIVKTVKGVNCA